MLSPDKFICENESEIYLFCKLYIKQCSSWNPDKKTGKGYITSQLKGWSSVVVNSQVMLKKFAFSALPVDNQN